MSYTAILSLHIIFVVSWFAALFYIVRLFIYHAEAEDKEEPERSILKKQYTLMEKRLWYIIGWPAMILTAIFGTWMIVLRPDLLKMPFMHVKLGLVFGLILYHISIQRMLVQFKKDIIKYGSFKLRLWNEVATIFLVAIVFTVVMKDGMNWIWGVVGFLCFGIALTIAVRMYKNSRERKQS